MFDDKEFIEAYSEIDDPDIAGWEFFVESNSVKIYRQYNEQSGLYSYKIYGTMSGVLPETCAQVYVDIEYRKTWDSYVKEIREVEEGDKKGIYWHISYPWPMATRDYAYCREKKEMKLDDGRHVWVILSRGENFSCLPEIKGVVRVTSFLQSMVITTDGNLGTKAFMLYYDNPGGSIPTWLINWAAKCRKCHKPTKGKSGWGTADEAVGLKWNFPDPETLLTKKQVNSRPLKNDKGQNLKKRDAIIICKPSKFGTRTLNEKDLQFRLEYPLFFHKWNKHVETIHNI